MKQKNIKIKNEKYFLGQNMDMLSDQQFRGLLEEYGYYFLQKYVNHGEINKKYEKRIKDVDISFDSNLLTNYCKPNTREIFESLMFFKHIDKIKLINVLGEMTFVYKFNSYICLDIMYAQKYDGQFYLPKYFNCLEDSEILMSSLHNIIITDSIFLDQVQDITSNIWGYLYEQTYMKEGMRETFNRISGEMLDVSAMEKEKLYEKNPNNYVELSYLTEYDMTDIAELLNQYYEVFLKHPLYSFFEYICENDGYLKENYEIDTLIMFSTLNDLIYFYDPDENKHNNIKDPGWLIDYLFYYVKDDRFEMYDDLFYYIIDLAKKVRRI